MAVINRQAAAARLFNSSIFSSTASKYISNAARVTVASSNSRPQYQHQLPARFTSNLLKLPKINHVLHRAMTTHTSTKSPAELPGLGDDDVQRVLDFWFSGCEPGQRDYKPELAQRWFRRNDEFDSSCSKNFKSLIESLSQHTESTITTLATNPIRALALTILLDQLPRNIFRAPHSAVVFRIYDPLAQAVALYATSPERNFHHGPAPDYEFRTNVIKNSWFVMPFLHSEDLEMHRKGRDVVQGLKREAEEELRSGRIDEAEMKKSMEAWEMQITALDEHEEVVQKFGRYPHRNAVLGRETTEEEKEWLKTAPGWAT